MAASTQGGRRWGRWLAAGVLVALTVLVVAGEVLVRRAGPILKGRVIETLSTRFHARVELDALDVSLVKGLEVSGEGLRIYAEDDAARPMIAVREFSFHTGLRGLFERPMRVGLVRVAGMEVHIAPGQTRKGAVGEYGRGGKIEIRVERILCEDSALTLDTADAGREPKRFVLRRIELTEAGAGNGWDYDATLVNAVPKGDIHAVGRFGPWVPESPGDAAVSGHYTFDHADLSGIRGIAGVLSSVGDFRGRLGRIEVMGVADVPAFSLDTARQAVPLHAKFNAVVDGLTGDTYLQPVEARLRGSDFTCRGSIVNVRGKGHVIDLEVEVPNGNVQDFLALAVKTRPVVMTGRIMTKAKVHIPYGKVSVMQKIQIRAAFGLRQIRFTNSRWQDQVNELSMRGQGRPAEVKTGAADAASEMKGNFVLEGAKLNFSKLEYTMPGAAVDLEGVYSLDGEQFDFHGTARTQAKSSEMVQSWWKQLLLKPMDHYLTKGDAGLVLPITVNGTRSDPKIGLDLKKMDFGHMGDAKKAAAPVR